MKVSNRDWVRLSAFLDQELSLAEREKLQRRITTDPDLRAALEELQTARQVLRQAPRIKTPRDFRLTPAQVGVKVKPRRLVYQNYRLAAVLASFLLVGVLVFDLGTNLRLVAFAPAMAPASDEMMMEKVVEQPLEEAAEEPSLLAAEAESARAAEEGEYQGELAATQPALEAAAPAAEGLAEEAQVPTVSVELEAAPAPGEEAPGETKTGVDEEAQAGTAADEALDNQGSPSPTAESLAWEADAVSSEEQLPPREPVRREVPILRILEVVLGFGVIVLGTASVISRRRVRR